MRLTDPVVLRWISEAILVILESAVERLASVVPGQDDRPSYGSAAEFTADLRKGLRGTVRLKVLLFVLVRDRLDKGWGF